MSFNADIQRYVDQAKAFFLHHIPEDRNQRIYLAAGSFTVAGVVLYPLLHHTILGREVSHTHPNASSRQASLDCGEIANLPKDMVENPKQYRIVHDKVVKRIPELTIMLSEDLERNFTKLLRHNMINWSQSPQAWFLWFALKTPEQRSTFSKEHIESLDFVEGDRICGVYEVVKRNALRAEIRMAPTPQFGPVVGLLNVALRPRNEGAALVSETIQWVRKDTGVVLPLERWLGRFLHDWVARSLSITGADYLKGLSNN